ncbi:uncharacterized protein LOC141899158 [Tubulanus polymorphus]|uniref:uncharacterized protein LOC141899158 n=1 Tax=Tubulanus polymorphus TaxID=672921 RepID=UPI003DA46850
MKLKLEVLASTAIKRKKPWPQFAWLGQETETLFMIDSHRLSVLYLPSGKTKRKIPKLHQLFLEVVITNHSKNGNILIGLLHSGEIFLWCKDQDALRIIHGIRNLMYGSSDKNKGITRPKIQVSNDGTKIVVVMNNREFYVWERLNSDGDEDIFSVNQTSDAVPGLWTRVQSPAEINIPENNFKETTVTISFYENQVLGNCCMVSCIFYVDAHLAVSTVLIRWSDFCQVIFTNGCGYEAEWSGLLYPIDEISPKCRIIRSHGGLVGCYGNQCQVVSVAVNQKHPADSRLLHISPLSGSVVVADLKGCGQKDSNKYGRTYWIVDMKWLSDDLFVACMTKQGSVCILSKLGEPILVQTFGCSVELGPSYYIPLHPLIMVHSKERRVLPNISTDSNINSTYSELDLMRQRFSLTVHPRYPALLCSDGYMVTVLVLPENIHALNLMTSYVAEANHNLDKIRQKKNIDVSLIDTLKFSDIPDLDGSLRSLSSVRHLPGRSITSADRFKLDDINRTLDSTVDSVALEVSGAGNQFGIPDLEFGKIFFGDEDFGLLDDLAAEANALDPSQKAQISLFNAWSLAVTNTTPWSAEMEKLTQYTISLLVKLFTVTLLQGLNTSMRQTNYSTADERLSQVFSMYRSVLHLVNFDVVQQNLIPVVLHFINSTVDLLLTNSDLKKSLSRAEILNSSFMMLLFTEREYSEVYTLLMKQEPISRSIQYTPAILCDKSEASLLKRRNANGILSCRLSHVWNKLLKHISGHYNVASKLEKGIPKALTKILCMTQRKIQDLKCGIVKPVKFKLSQGDEMYLDGSWYFAVHIWKERFKELPVSKLHSRKAVKILHSILYTSLQVGELRFVIEMANTLLNSITEEQDAQIADDHETYFLHNFFKPTGKQTSPIQLPCTEFVAARKVIQTIARFMAAYFSNQPLFIYPPHSVKPLPSLLTSIKPGDRVLPVYHKALATIISEENLDSLWTNDRVMEYLLIAGLLPEAAWFANKVGDWKSAFILSVACQEKQKSAVQQYGKRLKSLLLPEDLTPISILQSKLERLQYSQTITGQQPNNENKLGARFLRRSASVGSLQMDDESNIEQLTKSIADILNAATISCADITPWLLNGLVDQLKALVQDLTTFVPQGYYLPAPPLFCPQPTTNEENWPKEVEEEHDARMKIASLVQLILIIMKASRTALPAVYWYIEQVCDIHSKAEPFRNLAYSTTADLDNVFNHFKEASCLSSNVEDPSVHAVLSNFRDFCSIMWMLHTRDKMNLSLRQKAAVLKGTDVLETNDDCLQEDQWLTSCYTSLQWTVHMIPFMQFWESSRSIIYEALLSQLVEFPANKESADILTEFFHDESRLDPEVQEKSDRLLKDWQGCFISDINTEIVSPRLSPRSSTPNDKIKRLNRYPGNTTRGKTLSSYFHQQCRNFEKKLKQRAKIFGDFEEFVSFDDSERAMHVGSRAFEFEGQYVEFLDTMFDIVFLKMKDDSNETTQLPLLPQFVMELRKQELSSMSFRIVTTLQQNQNLSMFSGRNSLRYGTGTPPTSPRKPVDVSPSPRSPRRQLTRRHSLVEMNDADRLPPVTPILKKSSSQGSLDHLDTEQKRPRRSVSFSHEKTHYFGHYPLMRRSNSIVSIDVSQMSNESSSAAEQTQTPSPHQNNMKNKRSFSLSDLRSRVSAASETNSLAPEVPFSVFLAFRVNLGEQYSQISKLLEWLTRWGGKHHVLNSLGVNLDINQPTIRVKVHPYLILLSLWLIENKYEKLPLLDVQKKKQKLSERSPKDQKPPTSPRDSPLKKTEAKVVEKLTPRELPPAPVVAEISAVVATRLRSENIPEKSEQSSSTSAEKKKSKSMKRNSPKKKKSKDKIDGGKKKTEGVVKSSATKSRSRVFASRLNLGRRFNQRDEPSTASDLSRISERASEADQSTIAVKSPNLEDSVPFNVLHLPESDDESSEIPVSESLKLDELRAETVAPVEGSQPVEFDQTNMNDLGQHLSGVIRSELRRIVEIQHKSVLAMLGAVEGESYIPPQQPQPVYTHHQSNTVPLYIHSAATQTTLTLKQSSQASKGTVTQSEARIRRHRRKSDERQPANLDSDGVLNATDFDVSSGSLASETIESEKQKSALRNTTKTRTVGTTVGTAVHQSSSSSKRESSEKKVEFNIPEKDLQRKRQQKSDSVNYALNELHALTGEINREPIPLLRITNQSTDQRSYRQPFRSIQPDFRLPSVPTQAWIQPAPYQHNENVPPSLPFFSYRPRPPAPPVPSGGQHVSGIPFPLLHIPKEPQLFVPPAAAQYTASLQQRQFIDNERIKQEKLREFQEEARAGLQARDAKRFGINLLHIDFNAIPDQERRNEEKRQIHRIRKYSQSESSESEQIEKSKSSSVRPVVSRIDKFQQMPSSPERTSTRSSHKSQSPEVISNNRSIAVTTEVKDADNQYDGIDEDNLRIHHGYAIKPGSYDEYLYSKHATEGPDTSAKVQYDVLVKNKFTSPKKVEFATSTEDLDEHVRRQEPSAWKQFTDYMVSVQNGSNVLPPDIFFGLRFGNDASQPVQEGPGSGRSYINVIDIDAGVMDDIVSSTPQRVQIVEKPRSRGSSPTRIAVVEKGVSPIPADEMQYRTGPDPTTLRMFSHQITSEKQFADQIIPGRAARSKSKNAVMRKLQEMNQQINAIDEMSRNIEEEYSDTKLLMNTIENLNEAVAPGDSYYPRADVLSSAEYSPKSTQKVVSPRKSEGIPSVRASAKDAENLRISGLSGVSDIIGEVIARGDIDAGDYGLTENEARKLVDRANQLTARDDIAETDLNMEQLQEIFHDTPRESVTDDTTKQRNKEELNEFIEKRRAEQREQYIKRLQQLREAERHPYKPGSDKLLETGTIKEIQALDRKREAERKSRFQSDIERRKEEAAVLMADIIKDQPETPAAFQSRPRLAYSPPPTQQSPPPTTATTTRVKSPLDRSRVFKPKSILARSPVREVARSGVDYDPDWMHVSQPVHDRAHPQVRLTQEVLHSYDVDASSVYTDDADTARALASYTRQIEAMDYHDESKPPNGREQEQPSSSTKIYKPKPLKAMVKMQRPEITRKTNKQGPRKKQTYAERLAELNKGTAVVESGEISRKEQEKIYGSKRIPGVYPAHKPSVTRPLKTYTERLQEMKNPSATFTKPIRKSGENLPPGYRVSITKQGITSKKPAQRPSTYTERLQQTSARQSAENMESQRVSVPSVTRRQPRKPVTYVEQLQKIQAAAPKPKHKQAYGVKPQKTYHSPPVRSHVRRTRPYADPYADPDDIDSDISPLSMDEAVHRILYEDDDSMTLGAEAALTDDDDQYKHLVDVNDLVGSISEGSIMSVIDWDAVNMMIADV